MLRATFLSEKSALTRNTLLSSMSYRLSERKNIFMCRFFVYAVHISTFAFLFLSLVDDAWMFSSSSSSEDEGTESPILGMYILNTMKSGVKHKCFCLNPNSRTFYRLLQSSCCSVCLSNTVFTLSPKHVSNKHVSSKQVFNSIFHTSYCFQTRATHWFYNFFVFMALVSNLDNYV